MRTTVFAFMGLMAAGGLALVAIFVQMGFPVISPAPLPSDPSRFNAVAEAEIVTANRRVGSAVPAPRAARGADLQAEGGVTAGGTLHGAADEAVPTPVTPPADSGGVSTPANGGGGGTPATAPNPAPAATPAASPAPTSAPKPAPAPTPVPAPPQKPEPTPPLPVAPAPVAAPGNSSSGAAAAHASDRGIEASSKSTASAPAAAPPTSPGNGNGKALGHDE
jgi:outer membrane biosynthesis protein TonB